MIVVFGSINLDIVTHVERIAGPGETVLGPSYARIPGGKGANQALAARRAGSRVALVGAVGRDGFADVALSLLDEAGVDLTGVARNDSMPTGAAFISVDAGGQNAITVAAGANGAAQGAAIETVATVRGDTLLLQREVPDREGAVAARFAKARGARVILNLAPAGNVPEDYLAAIDCLVVNEFEAETIGLQLGAKDHAALAATLADRFATDLVVTLGGEGAVGWHQGRASRARSLPITPLDTTGAGDTFVGAFAAALDAGADFGTALRRGAAAGSLACTKHGAQPSIPSGDEVTRALAAAG